jgi:putative hemolysin
MVILFIILIILIILSGFFSGIETAYVSLTHVQIKKLTERNTKKAKIVETLKDDSHRLITTVLIFNNLVNIGASALATYMTIERFGSQFIGITTGILTLIILIFGEISPKRIAMSHNEVICLHTASILHFLIKILAPLIWIIDKLNHLILIMFIKEYEEPKVTEEDIINAVEIGEEIGELEPQEKRMIHNIFRFNDVEVKDIMIHRTDVFSLEEDMKVKDVINIIKNKGYSRIPVYNKNKDNISGVLLLKKLLPYINKKTDIKIKKLMIKPLFVPETRKIDNMLREFKKKKTHIAIILDEKGGFSGIVTIEDVIEEIVGEIYDETDIIKKKISRINKSTYMIRGDTEIERVNRVLGLCLSEEENFEQISRYILRKTGEFPEEGKEVKVNKGKFIIHDVKNNRIEFIKYIKK